MPPTRNKSTNPSQSEKSQVPGLQKIKSAIRQATRLLAKDKLAADVRIETERRLKALQSDLEEAQKSRLEKKMAVRYHKIKFFERQKALRKILSAKRQLEDTSLEGKARRKVEKSLFEHRVDLNYVLHFPKTRKYVSLFPSPSNGGDGELEQNEATPVTSEPSETDKVRQEIREWARSAMKKGELEAEPEDSLGQHDGAQKSAPSFDSLEGDENEEEDADLHVKAKSGGPSRDKTNSKSRDFGKSRKKYKGVHSPSAANENLTLEGDDFFGSD